MVHCNVKHYLSCFSILDVTVASFVGFHTGLRDATTTLSITSYRERVLLLTTNSIPEAIISSQARVLDGIASFKGYAFTTDDNIFILIGRYTMNALGA